VVACMQPDSIRPAARIPNTTFSDDISFPIESLARTARKMQPGRDDSVGRIMV
jgi:hypothetical protein